MPHYVTEVAENRFIVYSTIVDGPLTNEMSAKQMRDWLDLRPDYKTWLQPYDAEQAVRDWANGSEGMARHYREIAKWYYWHMTRKFCYVKLADAYFVLPESEWRHGE